MVKDDDVGGERKNKLGGNSPFLFLFFQSAFFFASRGIEEGGEGELHCRISFVGHVEVKNICVLCVCVEALSFF